MQANEDTKETSGEIGSENFSRQNETRSSKRLETLNVHEQPVAEKVATKKRTRTSSGEEVVLEGHKVDGKTTDCKCTWCTKGMVSRGPIRGRFRISTLIQRRADCNSRSLEPCPACAFPLSSSGHPC